MSKRSYDEFRDREENDTKRHKSQYVGELPRIQSIFHGEVARVQPYGAFVKIPGCRKQGLVHKSQMSTARVDDPSEIVAMGEMVYCKVISMEEDGEKISLSMKAVNQTTGQDLDPNNVQQSLDDRKKKKGHRSDIPKIELGAVYDTTCKKCGGHGHLAQDCFHRKGEKSYDLIPDGDGPPAKDKSDGEKSSPQKKKKNKKEKKLKKSKKKKHKHKHKHSHVSSEDESPAHKKKHRRRYSCSDSDNTSDSEGSVYIKKRRGSHNSLDKKIRSRSHKKKHRRSISVSDGESPVRHKKKHRRSISCSDGESPVRHHVHKKKHKHHKSHDSDSSPTEKKKHRSRTSRSPGPSAIQHKLLKLASYE